MTFRTFCLLSFIVLAFGCTTTANKEKAKQAVEVKKAIEITDSVKVKTIGLHKVATHIRRGTILGKLANSPFCLNTLKEIKWKLGKTSVLANPSSANGYLDAPGDDFFNIFREELEAHGWPVAGRMDDLFEGYDLSQAEVLIAALVTDLKSALCAPLADYVDRSPDISLLHNLNVNEFMGLKNWDMKGSMTINVEWQIYSPARHSLIGTIETTGSAEIKEESDDATYMWLKNFDN